MRRGAWGRGTAGAGGTGGIGSGGGARGGGRGGTSASAGGANANLLELRKRPNQGFRGSSGSRGSGSSGSGAAGGAAESSRYGRSNQASGMWVRAGKMAWNSGNVGSAAGSSGTLLHCNSSNIVCLTSRCACAEKPFASKAGAHACACRTLRHAFATACTLAVSSEACAPPCMRPPRYSWIRYCLNLANT